ncbi:MAG: MCP four helix bundle domain-containing protein, partial [Oscillospiraceae bacterium]|nr:MCP four helix bundle domain-containing protein [Oscillospiraceae bacterium]
MKNLRVSAKLIVSFIIVIALAVIVGVVGIFGMLQLDEKYTSMYDNNLVPLPYMSNVTTMFQQIRVNLREFTIGAYADNQQQVENARTAIDGFMADISTNLDAYEALISNEEVETLFTDARTRYEAEFLPFIDALNQAALAFDEVQVLAISADSGPMINFVSGNFAQCMDIEVADASAVSDANTVLAQIMLTMIIVVLVIAVVIAMILAFYISGLISKPLRALSDFMKKAGSTGDISMTQEDADTSMNYGQIRDEIGETIKNTSSFLLHITHMSDMLRKIANGDLTPDIKLLSENDTIGTSLKTMLDSLNNMFGEIHNSTNQVSTGAKQIADGSQALAQGSTEQAASVEQLSSSISEIAEKTKTNADMAGKAAALADTIMRNAEKGSQQMNELTGAVRDINTASQNISKVIKSIE